MNYTFSSLNDKEFELIVKDLLNSKFNLNLQSFKVGKDKGCDLRFSTPDNSNSIVVQVKHYIGSKFAQLKHILKEEELPKIKILNPERYIVATSLPLSAKEKDELKNILKPYVLNSNDILGQDDLNSYLDEFKEIETRYYKLWLSSINVLNAVLNNAIEGRTKYLLENISRKIPFYVITEKLEQANKILQNQKLLLITGQPGIGKTTLAEIMLFDRAKNGYKIHKVENIREAEDVVSPNKDEKQIFYFDDFLGSNYLEIVNMSKTETQLTSFIERIKNTPNKYLILTTRTVILNYAIKNYEKINQSKIATEQFELKLTDYSKYEKALILYNHLYFRNVKEDLHNGILKDKFYNTIISHENYTPRIIEFITDNTKIQNFSVEQFYQFIQNNLNNPKDIWSYSFENQIQYFDRCLLTTLFTFDNWVSDGILKESFESRLNYEKEVRNQVIEINQFNNSLKILLNGFVVSYITDIEPLNRLYSFINPSLVDFLIGYISESPQEKKSIISTIIYFDQLDRFDPDITTIALNVELQLVLAEKIAKLDIKFYDPEKYTNNKKYGLYLQTLCKYCKNIDYDDILLYFFKKIDLDEIYPSFYNELMYVLKNIGDMPQSIEYIKQNFTKIIGKLMILMEETEDAYQIPKLFNKYGQNFNEYLDSDDGFGEIINTIENVLQYNEEILKEGHKDEVKQINEVENLYEEIYDIEKELKNQLLNNMFVSHDFGINLDYSYWDEKINENIAAFSAQEDYAYEYYKDRFMDNGKDNEDSIIDDLFIKTR